MAPRNPKSESFPSDPPAPRAAARASSRGPGLPALLALAAALLLSPLAGRAQDPSLPPDGPPGATPPPFPPGVPPPVPPSEGPLSPPLCRSASAILVDAATGSIIWERNAHVRRPIASTTKIMTATLILESGRLDDIVCFSEHARHTDYANLNAKPGERLRMTDLLYAILLRSSNDSCVAVAEHLAGSTGKFARQMTQKARDIGAMDTNFVTPNGLYHPQHYSTAYDLALMTRYAIRYPLFNQVVATKAKYIDRPMNPQDQLLKNHNKFLLKYAGADGIKTGYVSQSGKCLVASSTRLEGDKPWRLISVVLNSQDIYADSAALMDWGRKNFQPVFFAKRGEQVTLASVRGGSHANVPLVVQDDLIGIIRRNSGKDFQREIRAQGSLQAPVRGEQVGGTLVGLVDGRPVAQADLVAAASVSQSWTSLAAPWTGWGMLLFCFVMSPRYARAFTKGPRRRRRRVAPRRRAAHCGGESYG